MAIGWRIEGTGVDCDAHGIKILETFETGKFFIGASGDGDGAPFTAQAAVFGDELTWVCPVIHGRRYAASVHADVDVVAHFKMKVRGIHAAVRAYRSDLLAALYGLSVFHTHFIKVTIERIDEFN